MLRRKRGANSLPGHLDQPERADPQDLGSSPIALQALAQLPLDAAAMALITHVDEVVNDHAAEVTQADLTSDFPSCGHVDLVGVLLGIGVGVAEVPAVDIDGDQSFGLVDDERTTSGERHAAALDAADFFFDLVLQEDRFTAFVELDAVDVPGHDDVHELASPLESRRFVDLNRLDITRVDVANGPGNHVGLFVDHPRPFQLLQPFDQRLPESQQVVHVAMQVLGRAIDPCGADDEAQPLGRNDFAEALSQPTADVFVLDLATDPQPLQPRHQHQIATRDADIRRESRPLGADPFLDALAQGLRCRVGKSLESAA